MEGTDSFCNQNVSQFFVHVKNCVLTSSSDFLANMTKLILLDLLLDEVWANIQAEFAFFFYQILQIWL